MNQHEKAQIAELLRQREQAFVQVWNCETQINRILGDAYPFDVPPLPSTRRKKGDKRRKKRSSAAAVQPSKVRRLKSSENAYRIVYAFEDRENSSLQVDNRLINRILQSNLDELIIKRIETVYEDDTTTVVRDVLWPQA